MPPEIQRKRYYNYESRRIWKLAAVMGERMRRVAKAAETAEKMKQLEKTIVRSYSEVMKRESTQLYKERVSESR